MAKNMNKEPQTYLGKKMLDPEFRKLCREAKLRVGIAIEIARIRHEKKITQKELAKRIDSNQVVLSRIENGQENLSLDKLASIAHALGVSVQLKFT